LVGSGLGRREEGGGRRRLVERTAYPPSLHFKARAVEPKIIKLSFDDL